MDEYIERIELIEEMKRNSLKMFNSYYKGYVEAIKDVADFKKADVQPVKRGKWDFQGDQLFRCTNCTKIYTQEQLEDMGENWAFPNFCPNCGAGMDGDAE